MTFADPLAPTDYEAIMGVQPASINPHLPTAALQRDEPLLGHVPQLDGRR